VGLRHAQRIYFVSDAYVGILQVKRRIQPLAHRFSLQFFGSVAVG